MNRRSFIRNTVVAGAGSLMIPEIVRAAIPDSNAVSEMSGSKLQKDAIILFQGDSITDAGRNRKEEDKANDQQMLGRGYPLFAAASILAKNPDKNLKIFNRGISGNKVFQLAERWDKDCLELQPNLLSILIGVNDYWHTRTGKYDGTIQVYQTDYKALIERTLSALPSVRIVICEPFLIYGGTALDDTWNAAFAPYREIARSLAKEYKLTFVPFQKVYDEALKKAPASFWGPDGVHPALPGAQLMAEAWIKSVF
jgi:lysophospholipase L1-like esterase